MKTVYVYDEITEKTVEEIRLTLSENKKVEIKVSSGGGSIVAGMKIYNMICKRQLTDRESIIFVSIDGAAAGVASFCFLCADDIFMDKDAYFILTRPFTMTSIGDKEAKGKELEKVEAELVRIYNAHLKMNKDKILELMESEQSIDLTMAISYGLAHQEA